MVFSEDGHAPPALLPPVLLLHDVVGAGVLHTPTLASDGVVLQLEGRGEAQLEVGTVPCFGEGAPRA